MPRFLVKPVYVEAMQYTGPRIDKIDEWMRFDDWLSASPGKQKCRYRGGSVVISGHDGEHVAAPGDWIIRDPSGDLRTCPDRTFSATYERA